MKCLLLGIIGLTFTSCLGEKNLYDPGNEDQGKDKIGLTTDFTLKTETSVIIHATDIDGKDAEGVEFGVYICEPCSGEDGILTTPAYIGYTNHAGQLEAKVVVPNNISDIYVIPLSAGYSVSDTAEELPSYNAQGIIEVSFSAVPFPVTIKTRGIENNESYAITGGISNNFQELYVPYRADEVSKVGIPIPIENGGGNSLVSKVTLPSELTDQIESLFPEKKNVNDADLSKNSDLRVVGKDGAEVWVTYIGDGGFNINNANVYNCLMYYNYTDSEIASMSYLTPATLHMTMLFPNTNQRQCPAGLKIQLLYWNGTQYSTIFPEGTRIGFAAARQGYKGSGVITSVDSYTFKRVNGNKYFPELNGDVQGSYYSTPQLNQVKKTQAVTRRLNEFDCCVTGFDIRPIGDRMSDYDFNDVLFSVSSSPIDAIQPGTIIDPIEVVTPTESTYGMLAFEDLWPFQGDYDMNDFVVNYAYTLEKNKENNITGIKLEFQPVAKGAAGSTMMGFGIELPLDINCIDPSRVEGALFETGNEKPTFVIWENVSDNIPKFSGSFINTTQNNIRVLTEKQTVVIPLKFPVSNISIMKFNPFIFVGRRSHEIHLPDFAPTIKMDMSLLGTGIDCSDISKGIYYRMENMYSWALDFPRESEKSPGWRYPKERSSIINAYPKYVEWIVNKTNTSWFNEGNVDEIY